MTDKKLWWTTEEIANKEYELWIKKSENHKAFSKTRWLSSEAAAQLADDIALSFKDLDWERLKKTERVLRGE